MNVRLNETWNYSTTVGVDHRVSGLSRAANLSDVSITDEQITVHDGVCCVHRDESSVLYQD